MAQQLGSNYYNSPFKFNGKELDEETGFYYYGARYYDPKISIWLSVDPLAEKFPNFNPYNYVMQNPLNLIDPTGMAPEEGGATDPPKGATAGATYNDPDNGKLTYNGSTWQRADGAAVLNEVEVGPGAKISGIDPKLAYFIDLKSDSFMKKIDKMADLKNFEIRNFKNGINYETQKLGPKSLINNGKLYEEGTEESLKKLRYIKTGVKIVKFGVPVVGLAYSSFEWTRGDISGELLALDGVMTGVGFTGFGAPISAVYFIGIRGGAMGMDREIVQKIKQNKYNNPQTPYNVRVQDNVKVNVINIH